MTESTRERIVEAAFRVLSRDGYVTTTVKDIAAEGGVAPGLVHYYFTTKEELVVAALEFGCSLMRPGAAPGDPAQYARDAFDGAKSQDPGRTAFRRLFIEMAGLAVHNDAIRVALLRFVQADRGHVEAAARNLIAAREEWPLEAAPAIAAAVWGALTGIAIQELIDPDFDMPAAVDALAQLALD